MRISNLAGGSRPPKLFRSTELRSYFEDRDRAVAQEVAALPEAQLPQVDESAWAGALAEKYAISMPVIDAAKVWIDPGEEAQLPIENWQHMFMAEPWGPRTIPGRRSYLHVPFTGDAEIFGMQGSTFGGTKPIGDVEGNEVQRPVEYPDGHPPDFQALKMQYIGELQRELEWLRSSVDSFNANLGGTAIDLIRKRREAYRSAIAAIEKSGIPMRPSGKVPVREVLIRRPRPRALTLTPKTPIEFDTSMRVEIFDHIVDLIRKHGRSMETSPASFQLGEEDLRHHIRAMLNTHYTDVSGEAFNFKGKTDLFVRVEEQNVFIGECKFWTGPKGYTETIDQLFGYSGWRDVRLCAVIFVKTKGLTEVLRKGRETLEQHPRFVKIVNESEDTGLRAEMRWPGDDQRIVTLHAVFIHLPEPV